MGRYQLHILPYSDVSVSDSRNPVPSFRAEECRTIETEGSSVLSTSCGRGLLMRNAGVCRRIYVYREAVFLACQFSDVETAADECSGNIADLAAIEPDVCLIIYAVEKKFESLSAQHFFR